MTIGEFKAGSLRKQQEFQNFLPNPINHEWSVTDGKTLSLFANANRLLGELNAFGQLVPDVDFFIRMHVEKEATASSRIEGTQTSIDEALLAEEYIDPERRSDWLEVRNYVQAMNEALQALEKLPLSNRLLCNAHRTLLSSGRGKTKQPGEFRTSQNWIGPSLKNATFVPPSHTEVPELMSDLERFLHNEKIHVPHLIRIAIAHYQFETIHPFLDGNGRLGRLLITLYLVSEKLLEKPTLYLSGYFDKNRSYYYDYLNAVRYKNDLEQWVQFFLTAIAETAANSIATFKKINELREEIEYQKILQLGKRAPAARVLLHALYREGYVTAQSVATHLNVSIVTANALIADFVRLGILDETTGFKRNRIFAFSQYLDLFRD